MAIRRINIPTRPFTHQERALQARVRDQHAKLQYILSHLTMNVDASRHTDAVSTSSLEHFVTAFYPFPQALEPEAIRRVLEDTDILKRVEPIYERAKMIRKQRVIFQRTKDEIYQTRIRAAAVDPDQPNTLGWRAWYWAPDQKMLRSIVQTNFYWESAELRVNNWDTSDVVRGTSGIHACLMPINWEIADPRRTDMPFTDHSSYYNIVVGVVERFGRYVLGTTGWRAEWVIIRKLLAPTQELGLQIEIAYPDVHVKYFDTVKYGVYL